MVNIVMINCEKEKKIRNSKLKLKKAEKLEKKQPIFFTIFFAKTH